MEIQNKPVVNEVTDNVTDIKEMQTKIDFLEKQLNEQKKRVDVNVCVMEAVKNCAKMLPPNVSQTEEQKTRMESNKGVKQCHECATIPNRPMCKELINREKSMKFCYSFLYLHVKCFFDRQINHRHVNKRSVRFRRKMAKKTWRMNLTNRRHTLKSVVFYCNVYLFMKQFLLFTNMCNFFYKQKSERISAI